MKVVVIDGQGGKMGAAVISELAGKLPSAEIVAVGTNSIATSAMLSSKPTAAATGENAVIVNCRDADFIIGPIGIVVADSLHGEISPAMSAAVGQSRAKKILIPVSRCNTYVVGVSEYGLSDYIRLAVEQIR
jgi:hypothetical protein